MPTTSFIRRTAPAESRPRSSVPYRSAGPPSPDGEIDDEHEALADWIAWLMDRYSLDHRTVPCCWDQHGALVEELSALRTAWLASYAFTGHPEALSNGTVSSPPHARVSPTGGPAAHRQISYCCETLMPVFGRPTHPIELDRGSQSSAGHSQRICCTRSR
jgi:hypothetical protein